MFGSSNTKDNKMISKNHKCLFCGFNFKMGFTLIELLAALVVLAIIALIVYPTIGKVLANNKTKAYEKQLDVIEVAASNWLIENEGKLKDNAYALPINDIVGSGFIEENELINPINNEPLTGCIFITWRKNIKQYEYNYVENCEEFIVPKILSLKASSSENEHGWRNKDFYVSLSGEYLENYYYCIDNKKCEPNIMVTDVNKTIAFNEEGIKYVCAYGTNKSGETESICEKYKLDKTKPIVGSIVFSGTPGLSEWFVSDVTVNATESTDALSGIDNSILSPSETLITKDTKGTTYTLTAKDKAGNVNTISYSVKVDKTKPTIGTLVINGTKGENGWYNNDLAFSITDGSDKTSGHKSTTSSASKITSDTTGTKVILTTKDNAGNTTTKEYTIKMDKTAPSAPTNMNFVFADWSVYTNNTWTNKNVYAASSKTNYGPSGSADSVSNVWKYQISTDNVNWVDYNYTASGIYLMDAEQVHTRYFRALDYAGNASNSISRTAKVDKTAPTTPTSMNFVFGNWSQYTDNTWTNQSIYAASTTSNPGPSGSSDTTSGLWKYQISTDNVNWVDYNYTASGIYLMSTDGVHTRYFRAVDNAGNVSSIISRTAKVDKTAPTVPTVTYNGGSNSCSWKNNYNLTLNSSDSLSGVRVYQVDWTGDSASNSDVASNFIPWNGYSSCNNRFRAVDNAGNISEWTGVHHIHMDTEKPVHTNWWWGTVNKDIAQLYIQATDNVGISRVQCPTSTATGGYNNWYWFNAVWDSSQNAYRCDITPSTFGHYNQTYTTHLYIYDHAGNGGYYNATNANIPVKEEYKCNSDEQLIEDSSKGFICVKTTCSDCYTTYSYDCSTCGGGCSSSHQVCSDYVCTKTSCYCRSYSSYNPNASGCCGIKGCTECGSSCVSGYYTNCRTVCDSYEPTYSCGCSTGYSYYCPTGYTTYSGSGSSMKCYRNADKN